MSATTLQRRLLGTGARPAAPARAIDARVLESLALFALAVVLGLISLGAKSLWLDEAVSVAHARLGLGGLWGVVSGGDPNMGVYYVALHAWVALFGDSETAVRSLSVVLGAPAAPALAALGRRLFGAVAGRAAGLGLAVSPFLVGYLQTARAYSLLVTLVTVSCLLLVAELQDAAEPRWTARRVAYVVVSALALYAHYFAALVLLVQAITVLAVLGRAALHRVWLTTGAALVGLCAPAGVFAARDGTRQVAWIKAPTLHSLLALPGDLAGGGVLAKLVLLLALIGVARRAAPRWEGRFAVAWLVLPVALAFAFSRLAHPLFVDYYLIVVLPALFLLAGVGVAALPGRAAPVAAIAALVVLSGLSLGQLYRRPAAEDNRAAARYLLAHARPSDSVLYVPAGDVSGPRSAIAYYLQRAGAPGPRPFAPARPVSRVWLITRTSDMTASQWALVARTLGPRRAASPARFANLTVALYVAR